MFYKLHLTRLDHSTGDAENGTSLLLLKTSNYMEDAKHIFGARRKVF